MITLYLGVHKPGMQKHIVWNNYKASHPECDIMLHEYASDMIEYPISDTQSEYVMNIDHKNIASMPYIEKEMGLERGERKYKRYIGE